MRFIRFLSLIASVFVALGACWLIKATHICRLSAFTGERTFYLDSASSNALVKSRLDFSDIFRVRGESVAFFLPSEETGAQESAQRNAEENFVKRVLEEYGAQLLVTESACGVTSYYAFVPSWHDGVFVGEKTVNLHIAIENNRCVVGTPIIFGGF